MTDAFDVVVIGSGPGGYVCAIRAAQHGLTVAVVEQAPTFGGTCLNVGCIPSKTLLHTSELFEEAAKKFSGFGIEIGQPTLDLTRMMSHKNGAVEANVAGVAYLFKKNAIAAFHGRGAIASPGKVRVTAADGAVREIAAKAIVVATGSEPAPLPGVAIDEQRIVSSTGALSLSEVPKRLVVIGAGVIGLELGSVWRRLGAEVTVVEYLDRILPGMDGEVSRQAQRIFARQGLAFRLSSKVEGVVEKGGALEVTVASADGKTPATAIPADIVLVAIGRRPVTAGLGLETLGIATDSRGRIAVDAGFRTSVDGVYAIGDVIAGPMLAHKAEDEGAALAERLAGKAGGVNHAVIPSVVYTMPEIASVGQTEEELKAAGTAYRTGKFPFTASGRARATGRTEGFAKVLTEEGTDRVLGVHILGANASEMIAEAAVLMEFGGSAEDLARTCHAHPTFSEAVREAAMAAWWKPVHL
ncbi:MAG: dihydrolipoyl dehydrogenase [Bauldia sp.]|nr:dihydrolipoyl dehydrogenase [Bauldia sp.]